METVRILSFKKALEMPVEIWGTVELVLKNAGIKFHKVSFPNINRENFEIIFKIDSSPLHLDELLLIAQELSQYYKIDSFCFDPGRTTLTNHELYTEATCQIILALYH